MKKFLITVIAANSVMLAGYAVAYGDEVVVETATSTYVVPTATGAYVTQPAAQTVVVNNYPPPAEDKPDNGWGEFNISGGEALFQGDSKDFLKDSPIVSLGFYGPTRRFGQMGLDVSYVTGADLKSPLPGRLTPVINGVAASGPFSGTVKAHIMSATPELRFGPQLEWGGVKFMPYIEGGGGFYWTHYNNDSIDFTQGSASLPSTNDYNGGWNAGGGVTIGLAHGIGIGADLRYHDIIYKNAPDTQYLAPEGRLVLFF